MASISGKSDTTHGNITDLAEAVVWMNIGVAEKSCTRPSRPSSRSAAKALNHSAALLFSSASEPVRRPSSGR